MRSLVTDLTLLGQFLLLYMILCASVILTVVIAPLLALFQLKRRKYVPKSKRWHRMTKTRDFLFKKICKPAIEWSDELEESWSEYYARISKEEHQQALRMQKDGVEATNSSQLPIWHRWAPSTRKKKKRRYKHTPTIHILQAIDKGICGYQSVLRCEEVTNSEGEEMRENIALFDAANKRRVGVDNRASACISDDPNDFEGTMTKVQRAVKGFGGQRHFDVYMGTIVWKWYDNEGALHTFKIPNSYYIPQGKCKLLSPQHWAKTQRGKLKDPKRAQTTDKTTGEVTTSHSCKLFWDK